MMRKNTFVCVTFQTSFMRHVMYCVAPVINTRKQLSRPQLPLNDNVDNNDVEIKFFPKFQNDYLVKIIIERFTSK